MSITESTGMRRSKAALILANFPAGSFLDIYSHERPLSPDQAPTGILLASFQLPADPWLLSGASAIKQGSWATSGLVGAGSGADAGWARLRVADDNGQESTLYPRIDFTIGGMHAPGDLTINERTIVAGQTVTLETLQIGG